MAQRTVTVLSDDLDGTESDDIQTVRFGLDGATYEIDLSPKNREALEQALSPYLDVARRAGGRAASAPKKSAGRRDAAQTSAIREWARKNGYTVSERGRIPREVEEAYSAAS